MTTIINATTITNYHHRHQSSPLSITTTTNHHHHQLSSIITTIINYHQLSPPSSIITIITYHHHHDYHITEQLISHSYEGLTLESSFLDLFTVIIYIQSLTTPSPDSHGIKVLLEENFQLCLGVLLFQLKYLKKKQNVAKSSPSHWMQL